jgi:hypothetical protein
MLNLKKCIFLQALFIFFNSFTSSAQETGFGIKAGANYSVLSGVINKEAVYKAGPHVGIYGFFRPTNSFAIQPEIIYSSQGCKNEWPRGKTTTKLDYVNIPLICKLYIGNKFYWQFGPQLGILANSKEKGTVSVFVGNGVNGYGWQDVEIDQNVESVYKSTDFSLVTGFGVNIIPELTLSARFNYGLSNIDSNPENQQFRGNSHPLANRVFQFSIGYNFGGDHQVDNSEEE